MIDKKLWLELSRTLLARDNVVGFSNSFRPRVRNGNVLKDEKCIRVYVAKKVDRRTLNAADVVPCEVGGFPTDVVEVGVIRALGMSRKGLEERTKPWRPLVFGISIGNRCFDEETVLMTKSGFKGIDEISYDDEIATLNPETQELEWQKPIRIFKYDYDGEMVHFKSPSVDLMVTPNHRVYCRVNRRRKRFEIVEAKDLIGRHDFEFAKTAKWNCVRLETVTIPKPDGYEERMGAYHEAMRLKSEGLGWRRIVGQTGVPAYLVSNWFRGSVPFSRWRIKDSVSADIWFEFMGWYLSEGCVSDYKVIISQKNEENRKRIIELIEKMGFKPIISGENISFESKQIADWLRSLGHAEDKYVPQYIKDAPPDQIRIFLDALFRGDGSFVRGAYAKSYSEKYKGKWFVYNTVSKRLAEDVCELLLKVGLSFHLVRVRNLYRLVEEGDGYRVMKPTRDLYRVFVVNKFLTPRMMKPPLVEHYKGRVWCVEVPNGIILAIRNGKPVWTGNSITAGTHGAAWEKDGVVYSGSNAHVYCVDATASSQPCLDIVQPGSYDGGTEVVARLHDYVQVNASTCDVANTIARIYNFLNEKRGGTHRLVAVDTKGNKVDFAVAEFLADWKEEWYELDTFGRQIVGHLFAGSESTSVFCKASNVVEITGYKPHKFQIADIRIGMKVVKSGRTTGVTNGAITDDSATLNVGYGTNKTALFTDVIMSDLKCKGGDSGSAVFTD